MYTNINRLSISKTYLYTTKYLFTNNYESSWQERIRKYEDAI